MRPVELAKRLLKPFPGTYRVVACLYRAARILPQALQAKGSHRNWLLCFVSSELRTSRAYGKPTTLNIEPTTICDQKCLVCETGLGILGRKPQYMSFDQYRSILDQFDHTLQTIFFYFMGESFLNVDAYRMIRYAADRGIYVHSCTNGNHIEPDALVRSGIADISFQIAGTTQEVHQIYRIGGSLESVLSKVQETVRIKNKLAGELTGNPHPMKISLGFILFRHNEHQVEEFNHLAKSLGVDEYQVIDPCVRSVEQGHALLPTDTKHWIYDPEAFARGELKMLRPPNNGCGWIYSAITIMVNGDVVPCCRDPKGTWIIGNVFDNNVYSIWNNHKFRRLRRMVATAQATLPLCSLCEGYGIPEPREFNK